jgi:hypothetical protein
MKERQHPRPVKLQITHTHIQKQTKKTRFGKQDLRHCQKQTAKAGMPHHNK